MSSQISIFGWNLYPDNPQVSKLNLSSVLCLLSSVFCLIEKNPPFSNLSKFAVSFRKIKVSMKHFVWLSICVLLLSACEKYKLNQPAYLDFNWALTNPTSSSVKYNITGGSFYLNSFQVTGDRKKGDDVDITKEIPSSLFQFSTGGALGVSMDVPVGEYQAFALTLNVPKDDTPCMTLNGTYNTGTEIIPMRIEWNNEQSLPFSPSNGFELKKKKNYKVVLAIDIEKLFSSLSANQWEPGNLNISMENDQPTLIIRSNNNVMMFNEINDHLLGSLYLTVE